MKVLLSIVLLLTFLLVPALVSSRHISRQHPHRGHRHTGTVPVTGEGMKLNPSMLVERKGGRHRRPDTLQIAGSSLPDCSHACGGCSPCRLVMVSFVCASLAEAETCPMAYKCMCRNKSYPVP
ncbi:hypothetical protein NMG60_11003016 [Bertholletia excelsa]